MCLYMNYIQKMMSSKKLYMNYIQKQLSAESRLEHRREGGKNGIALFGMQTSPPVSVR